MSGSRSRRPRLLKPYCDFPGETLASYPRLPSIRLFDMVRDRGYQGQARTLRTYVAGVRPKPRREVFLPLIGEQSQTDWTHAGDVLVPGGERPRSPTLPLEQSCVLRERRQPDLRTKVVDPGLVLERQGSPAGTDAVTLGAESLWPSFVHRNPVVQVGIVLRIGISVVDQRFEHG